jgi:hypothetical protein
MSADIAANEIDKLRNEIARLKGQTNWVCSCGGTDCEGQKENAVLRDTLDAVIEAGGRGVDLWRSAHPGNELVIPDRAEMVAWLLEQNAELRSAAVEVCALARVWVTVWGDKLSAKSIKRLEQLEKQILKKTQP